MGIFVSFGLVILAAFTHATLQLGTGSLILLLVSVFGQNHPARARSLARSFVSGFGTLIFLALVLASFIIFYLGPSTLPPVFLAVIVGLLLANAIVMWCFYYRHSDATALWLPRPTAHFLASRFTQVKTTTDAFSLGLFTCFAELPFSLALFFISAISITSLPELYRGFALVLYIIIAILPLLIVNALTFRGRTVVEIQRWRVKNKVFLKLLSGVLFLILATYIFAFEIIGVAI